MANVKLVVNDSAVFEAEGAVVMLNNASKVEVDGEAREIENNDNCFTFIHGCFDVDDAAALLGSGIKKTVEQFAGGNDIKKLLFCLALQSALKDLVDGAKEKAESEE